MTCSDLILSPQINLLLMIPKPYIVVIFLHKEKEIIFVAVCLSKKPIQILIFVWIEDLLFSLHGINVYYTRPDVEK